MKTFCAFVLLAAMPVCAGLTELASGFLSTPDAFVTSTSSNGWDEGGGGLKVSWVVSTVEDAPYTWNYQYTFTNASGGALSKEVSHFIISVSDNFTVDDVFGFTGDYDDHELNTFGSHLSNPDFPAGQTIWGLKIELDGDQTVVAFNSSRIPMWGDFYAKSGTDNQGMVEVYAYNVSFGEEVANLHGYNEVPVDADGNALYKILVPNMVPEPATLALLGLGGLTLLRKRRS